MVVVDLVSLRKIVVPKFHQLQTIVADSDDGLLHTNRVELLPSTDQIYGGLGPSNN